MTTLSQPLLRLTKSSLKDLSESSILRSFDLIIHAHLVYLYFLEYPFPSPPLPCPLFSLLTYYSNSTLRLLVRIIFQINILSPKSPLSAFASVDLSLRRATWLILASFTLGFIPHALFAGAGAGEATQGYLHGGLVIDFVGQRSS
jgi:hypothetical protein